MALTFNGTTPTVVTYNGTSLTKITFNGTAVWSSIAHTWQKSYTSSSIAYWWYKYTLSAVNTYTDGSWSSASAAGFSDIEGYTSLTFGTSTGFTYSGLGMAISLSAEIVYVGDTTSVSKYYGEGGTLMVQTKSCTYVTDYYVGTFDSNVSSTNSVAYPPNGYQDGYWWIYNTQITTYSKSTDIEVVSSSNPAAHNTTVGGAREEDGYWYEYLGTA